MKFMQRAAAAKSPTTASTQTAISDEDRPSKRQRTGERTSPSAPKTPGYVVDQKVAQAALDEEDRKRQAAIDRMAERLGDAHWVLDTAKLPSSHNQTTPLRVVQVGFSEIDKKQKSEESLDEEEEKVPSFQSYGPKKKTTKEQSGNDTRSDSDSDSDSDSESDSSDSESSSEESDDEMSQSKPGRTSYGSQKRDEIRSRKTAAQERARKMAADRRNKEVNLHKLTSISGGGVGSFSAPSSKPGPRR